jgi:hypothetical protein
MWSMLFYRFHSIYDTIKFVPQGVPVFTLLLAPEVFALLTISLREWC